MSDSEKAQAWSALARRTVSKVNLGWWLEKLTPLLIVLSLLAATGILVMRSVGQSVAGNAWFLSVAGVALLAAVTAAWFLARRHFITQPAALVRLEDRLHLKNALTTASRGVGRWPDAPKEDVKVDAGFDWNWLRVATPFLVAIMVVAASLLIPITSVTAAKGPPAEPLAWAQMEDWMETLEEEQLIDEKKIEEVRERIEELRAQPEEEWFSHSSLEASDNLRHTLNQNIQNLGAELATAERDLNALQNYAAQLSEEAKDRILAEYDQALKNLEMNGMPLNSELMNALKGIDPSQLAQAQMSQLTREQLDQLREALKNACQACSQCNGMGDGKGLPALGEMDPALAALLANCNKPGRGGVNRGPGPAPMFFGDETDLKTSNIEGVQNQDFSKAVPGEVLGIGETEHEIDETKTGPREAGAVGSVGQGGDTVWKESLMPTEKAVLKRYFK